jgi:hypothetical protein
MMSMGVSDAPVTDQTLDMSPMDLFDSIFWGEYFHISSKLKLTPQRSIPNEQFGTAWLRLFTAALYGVLGSRCKGALMIR